jgi:parallel beta-helix repeat protein
MLLLALLLTQGPQASQAPIALHSGQVLTRSARVLRRTYRISGVVIRGDNITVDFSGATLQGTPADTAIRIDGGKNVRIIQVRARGYKVGILARGTRNLTLEDNDLSYNWKPRLFSLVEHESLVDWLSFHHNEKDEWLRFGAAIYLADVAGGKIVENGAVQGMNGLLVVRCTGLAIRGNNFSFNSGVGIGLYRSSYDTIVHNWIDYNVRGYSQGFYSRGQDSADLLVYEQSSHNVIAHNSLTHGGDGVFLWAGQTTMDSGTGGANDNLIDGNDVSYATANGVEATFSRNTIANNRAWGNEYGVWGGYSFATKIAGNDFTNNRFGVAIEHGQDNVISGNRFLHDSVAIKLWADSIESSDWGYPKHHDTKSRDYRISGNTVVDNHVVLEARNTTGLDTLATPSPPSLSPPHFSVPTTPLSLRDRSAIVVDEWGPYDWQSPKLWPVDSTRAVPLRLAVLGQPGTWQVVSQRGIATLSKKSGRIGDTLAVTPAPDSTGDWEVTLQSKKDTFSYGRFEPAINWTVESKPVPRIDFFRYRPGNWSVQATGTVRLAPGSYTLRAISNNAMRLYLDEKLVIDAWTPHESQVDYADMPPGQHTLRVEYNQKDGWIELRVEIIRGSDRSPGSPGPH